MATHAYEIRFKIIYFFIISYNEKKIGQAPNFSYITIL
jgi:hypothetical protein